MSRWPDDSPTVLVDLSGRARCPVGSVRMGRPEPKCTQRDSPGSSGRPIPGPAVRRRDVRRDDGSGCSRCLLAALTLVLARPSSRPIHRSPSRSSLPVWLLAAGFYLAEAKVIHLHIGRSAHSFSMSELPLVAGLFLVSPPAFIVARLVGSALALFFNRRQRSVKLAFNLAQFSLASVVSVAIVHAVVSPDGTFGPAVWVAVLLVALVENVIGVLSVSTAISLAEGTAQYRRIPEMLKIGIVVSLTNASLALMAPHRPLGQPRIGLAVRPADGHRGAGLSGLHLRAPAAREHRAALRVDPDPPTQPAARYRDRLAARPRPQDVPGRRRRDPAAAAARGRRGPALPGRARRRGRGHAAGRADARRSDPHPRRHRAAGPARRPAADGDADAAGTPDGRKALVAPLLGESTLVGTLLVSDPLSDISTFEPEDLKLFETLANHTAIALENGQLEQSLEQLGRLKEELHHQALHDPLTGLANRSLFTQVVASRLEVARSERDGADRPVRRPRRLQARQRQPRPRRRRRAAGRGRRSPRVRSCAPATWPPGSVATSSPCSCATRRT